MSYHLEAARPSSVEMYSAAIELPKQKVGLLIGKKGTTDCVARHGVMYAGEQGEPQVRETQGRMARGDFSDPMAGVMVSPVYAWSNSDGSAAFRLLSLSPSPQR